MQASLTLYSTHMMHYKNVLFRLCQEFRCPKGTQISQSVGDYKPDQGVIIINITKISTYLCYGLQNDS